ncbi:hypothetical protein M0638_19580 [Roseomonas sp. NAR14]|uniref:Uncharacterized protein n=1 Tax=Roseomonas acroporae TaxID=2937791 RepID=A0A9X1YBC1_9PROT|nr:hypothetical protein [Roseomonas acroporae]MCK8786580.1 hypothetical protein [Roseomonas acroporae]
MLATDGRYVTLGRDSDPSEEEVRHAEDALRAQGLAGWLAVMEGNPYIGAIPKLMQVKPLAEPTVAFEDASATCVRAIRANRGV